MQTGSFWLTQGTLHGATSESNEPVLTGYPNGPTAWWRWTATASGTARVRTWGSEGATMVAVYRGATLDTTRLAFGSGAIERTNFAEALFSATAGETYSIQVLGAAYASPVFIPNPFLPSRLQLSLTFIPGIVADPANDNFAAAPVLTGSTADVIINNSGAAPEPGEARWMPTAGRHRRIWCGCRMPLTPVSADRLAR